MHPCNIRMGAMKMGRSEWVQEIVGGIGNRTGYGLYVECHEQAVFGWFLSFWLMQINGL